MGGTFDDPTRPNLAFEKKEEERIIKEKKEKKAEEQRELQAGDDKEVKEIKERLEHEKHDAAAEHEHKEETAAGSNGSPTINVQDTASQDQIKINAGKNAALDILKDLAKNIGKVREEFKINNPSLKLDPTESKNSSNIAFEATLSPSSNESKSPLKAVQASIKQTTSASKGVISDVDLPETLFKSNYNETVAAVKNLVTIESNEKEQSVKVEAAIKSDESRFPAQAKLTNPTSPLSSTVRLSEEPSKNLLEPDYGKVAEAAKNILDTDIKAEPKSIKPVTAVMGSTASTKSSSKMSLDEDLPKTLLKTDSSKTVISAVEDLPTIVRPEIAKQEKIEVLTPKTHSFHAKEATPETWKFESVTTQDFFGVTNLSASKKEVDPILEAFRDLVKLQQDVILNAAGIKEKTNFKDFVSKNKPVLSESTKALISDIEGAAYKDIHEKFKDNFQDITWKQKGSERFIDIDIHKDGTQTLQLSEKYVNSKPYSTDNGTLITNNRQVDLPLNLGDKSGPLHISLAVKDLDGKNIREPGAVYFSAHYDKAGKLNEITSPVPVEFSSKDKESPVYIKRDGKIYTLPVNRGQYEEMMQQVAKNKGVNVSLEQNTDLAKRHAKGPLPPVPDIGKFMLSTPTSGAKISAPPPPSASLPRKPGPAKSFNLIS